jgi:hypothetical protein
MGLLNSKSDAYRGPQPEGRLLISEDAFKSLNLLETFFHPILCFLGMATTPPIETEFPGFNSILDWEIALLVRYRSRDPELSARERSRMHTLKVATIRRFKERKRAEHEYLVAKVYDPDLGQNRYLRIQRYVCDLPHTQDVPASLLLHRNLTTLNVTRSRLCQSNCSVAYWRYLH